MRSGPGDNRGSLTEHLDAERRGAEVVGRRGVGGTGRDRGQNVHLGAEVDVVLGARLAALHGEAAVLVQADVHEHVEDVEDVVAREPVGCQRLGQVLLARAVIGEVVAQLVEPGRAAPAHVAPMVGDGVLDHAQHHVLARRLGIEVLERFRRPGAEDPVDRPALADVEHLAVVVGVVEHAVADLAALDLVDAQDLALGDLDRTALARRDDELGGGRPGHIPGHLLGLIDQPWAEISNTTPFGSLYFFSQLKYILLYPSMLIVKRMFTHIFSVFIQSCFENNFPVCSLLLQYARLVLLQNRFVNDLHRQHHNLSPPQQQHWLPPKLHLLSAERSNPLH